MLGLSLRVDEIKCYSFSFGLDILLLLLLCYPAMSRSFFCLAGAECPLQVAAVNLLS